MDFDRPVTRSGTASYKWDKYGEGVLPLWVADMDFASPPAVVAALRGARRPRRVRLRARAGLARRRRARAPRRRATAGRIEPELARLAPERGAGAQPRLPRLRRPGRGGDDGHAGLPAVPRRRRPTRAAGSSPCRRPSPGGRWQLPLEAMEAAVTPDTRVFLFCHPHNPLGRVWSADEVAAVVDFCRRHDLVLCSDEIHCDLVLDDVAHVPAARGRRRRRRPRRHAHGAEQDLQPAGPQLRLRGRRRPGAAAALRAAGRRAASRCPAASPSPPPRPPTARAAPGWTSCSPTCAATATCSSASSPRSCRACD